LAVLLLYGALPSGPVRTALLPGEGALLLLATMDWDDAPAFAIQAAILAREDVSHHERRGGAGDSGVLRAAAAI
jgi:hypothetical protein